KPVPTNNPTGNPTDKPIPTDKSASTYQPTNKPTGKPTDKPNPTDTSVSGTKPTEKPTDKPIPTSGPVPTDKPTDNPIPTKGPAMSGTPIPTDKPVPSSSLGPMPTAGPQCIALIKPIKDLISQTLKTIEGLPLGPEASALLKTAVGTNLSAYFDNSIDTVGSTSAILAATIPQLVDVIKAAQASLGPALGIADPAFQVLYDLLGQFTKAFADLAACTGAKPNCTGLVVLLGYAIKVGWPILRADLAVKFP
ncbi:hypothetical protein BGZ83_004783, partial [Gryganskiella cystojenkinii]